MSMSLLINQLYSDEIYQLVSFKIDKLENF